MNKILIMCILFYTIIYCPIGGHIPYNPHDLEVIYNATPAAKHANSIDPTYIVGKLYARHVDEYHHVDAHHNIPVLVLKIGKNKFMTDMIDIEQVLQMIFHIYDKLFHEKKVAFRGLSLKYQSTWLVHFACYHKDTCQCLNASAS